MSKLTPTSFADALRALVELDFDAIAAYEVALSYLTAPTLQKPLRQFIREHERHVRELSQLLLSHQEKIIKPLDVHRWLVQGPMVVNGSISDGALLEVLIDIETMTNAAYRAILSRLDRWPAAESILVASYLDEAYHQYWLEETYQRLR